MLIKKLYFYCRAGCQEDSNLEEDSEEDTPVVDTVALSTATTNKSKPTTSQSKATTSQSKVSTKATTSFVGKKAQKRKMWSVEEQAAVERQLGKYLHTSKLPDKHEIEESRKKEPVLLNRPWQQVKSYIKICKVSMQRRLNSAN